MPAQISFPLISIQLVADPDQSLAAFLLRVYDCDQETDLAPLAQSQLAETLGPLTCLLLLDDLPAGGADLLASLPPERFILLGASEVADAQKASALQAQGFTLSSEALTLGVDTPERFEVLKKDGAKWFAGVWHLAWKQKNSSAQTASQALMMRLLQLVANDADTRELEQVFKQDAALSYQLLRLVNSVAMGLPHKINSFAQAIVILGQRQLQRWLNLLVFAHTQQQQGGVSLLQANAVMRARFLELASAALGASRNRQEEAFIVGMFSLLDVLFGMSMEQIIRPLNLNNEIIAALLERRGEMGVLLRLAEAAEWGEAELMTPALLESGLSRRDFALAQLQAGRWMQDVVREMSGG